MDKIKKLRKFWKNKRVFVTGHTGFKGSWLCIMLKTFDAKIYGYSLPPDKNSLFNQAGLETLIYKNYYKDIRDYKSLNNSNRMLNMIRSGSKGSDINMGQMIACVGQQVVEALGEPWDPPTVRDLLRRMDRWLIALLGTFQNQSSFQISPPILAKVLQD